jgi:hypothetical protein
MEAIATEVVDTGEKRDACGRRIVLPRERESMIAAYERSGLTQRAFAEREKIGFYRFVSWLKQHRRHRAKSAFVEVKLPGRSVAVSNVEVTLPNGVVVRGGDLEQIAKLVERLARC